MLRNVAIPLMLAASEAEAQPSEAQIKAAAVAMKMDKDADIPELIAETLGECQDGNTDIGAAAALVSTKEAAVVTQTGLYNDAIAPIDLEATPPQTGGAWTLADVARKEAVAAAEAAEAAGTTLGVLLDELNALQQDERAKAKLYFEAEVAFVTGQALEASTDTAHGDLAGEFSTATDLKNAADAAVTAATAAIADEEMSRNWLYCELGAVPTFTYDRDGDGTADFEATKPGSWWAAQVAPGTVYTSLPPSCTVPQVLSAGVATPGTANANEADATACTAACTAASGPTCAATTYDSTAAAGSKCLLHETIIRPEITYFNLQTAGSGTTGVDFLTVETDVAPVHKWNATLALAQANLSITNVTGTSLGSIDRNQTGLIAYYEGLEMKYKWLVAQRTREERFFFFIKDAAATALAEAKEQAYGTGGTSGSPTYTYVMPTAGTEEQLYGWPSDWQSFSSITNDTEAGTPVVKNRFTAGEAGAANELNAAQTARDGTAAYNVATVGSAFRLPNTRAAEADGWAITAASQSGNTRDYVTTWTKLAASDLSTLNAWIGNNNTAASNASKLYTWWQAAYGASKIANDWNALMRTTASANQWDAVAAAATADTSVSVAGKVCASVGAWHTAAQPADEAACKASCVAYNYDVTSGMVMTNIANDTVLTWGSGIYLPRETTGGYWCSAFSFDDTANPKTCSINRQLLTAVVHDLKPSTQASGTWGTEDGSGVAGICKNMTNSATPLSDTTPVTDEILNFADLADRFVAAYDLGKQTVTAYTDMVTDANTQAGLETAWLQAYYYKQYWMAIEHYLTDTTASSTTKAYKDYWDAVSGTTGTSVTGYTNEQFEKASVEALQNLNTDNLAKARNELAYKQVDIALKQAHVDLLGTQLNRVQQQLDDLNALTRAEVVDGSTGAVTTAAGELIAAQAKRTEVYNEYNAASGALSVSLALTAKTNAAADVVERNMTTYPTLTPVDSTQAETGEGDLAKAKRDAQDAWTAAGELTTAKELEITTAEDSTTLASLRTAVETTGSAWVEATGDLDTLFTNMNTAKAELADAEKDLAATTLACQVAAYDVYRSALEDALATREGNLATIKAMLEALPETPAPGTEGSRCEKALSNGTYRPKRGEDQCGGKDSGLCCGGARIWMKTGTTADSGWRTIETCQKEDAETYAYQPPREPMALTMPNTVSATFACIEGAKALAAAASAAAAAVYMLA